jgi:rubrerythrin
MQKPTDIGKNRTGIATSPIDARRTEKGAMLDAPLSLDVHALEAERIQFSKEARPVGTIPPPGNVKGVLKTALEGLKGHKATVLIDQLGERLAFERTGSRLYDALLAKLEAADVHEGGPTRGEIERIRDDERQHFALVRDTMLELGGDPTAMTPSADIVGVASLGWVQVLTDPRTTLTQCLEIILTAELADNDGWSTLIELVEGLGQDDIVARFSAALAEEDEHLVKVRAWLAAAIIGQAGVEPTPEQPGQRA